MLMNVAAIWWVHAAYVPAYADTRMYIYGARWHQSIWLWIRAWTQPRLLIGSEGPRPMYTCFPQLHVLLRLLLDSQVVQTIGKCLRLPYQPRVGYQDTCRLWLAEHTFWQLVPTENGRYENVVVLNTTALFSCHFWPLNEAALNTGISFSGRFCRNSRYLQYRSFLDSHYSRIACKGIWGI